MKRNLGKPIAIGYILLLLMSIFPVFQVSAVVIGPGAPYYAYGYTNYTVGHVMTFSTVGITTRMQFNDTYIWTTATPVTTKVNNTLNYLHPDVFGNDTPGTLLINYTAKAPLGGTPVTWEIGGMHAGYQYAYYEDTIIKILDVADASGNVSFTNTTGLWDGFAHNITIRVSGAVPIVTTNVATGVTATNATMNGFLDDGGALPLGCTVRFEYGLTAGYGTNTSNQTKATGAYFHQNVVLAPSTYHFRAIADDGLATSYGVDRTFTIIGSPTVTTNGTTGVGTTNATLWGYLSSNGGSSSCNLSFQYGFSVAYGNTTSVTTTASSTLVYSKGIIGLTSGHLYHYRAKAYNGISTTYGADQTFNTVSIGGGGVSNPRQVRANWTTSSSLNITFTKGTNSTTTKIYRKIGSYPVGIGDGTLICNTTLSYYNDTGISPSIRYFYRAYGWHGVDGYSTGTNIAMTETDNTSVTTSSSALFKGYMTTDKSMWTHFHYSTVPTFATTIVNISMASEQYTETPTSYETLNVDYKRAQSFTVGNTSLDVRYYLYNVSLKAYRVGGLTTVSCQLYAAAGNFSGSGIPTGPVLAYGSKDVSTLTTSTSGGWVNITMSPYYLHTITRYCLVFTTSAGGGNQFNMLKDTAPDYTGGSIFESYGGGSYTNHTGDFIFSLYGHRPYTYTSATMTSNTTIPATNSFSIPQSDLISGQIYYYFAEGNDTKSNMTKGNTRHTLTNPDIPIYLNIVPYFTNNSVKISWLKGNGANNTVIAYSGSAYPSVVPGSTISYNGTGVSAWVHGISFNATYYFSLFSFTSWAGLSRFSSGVHIPWGGVTFIVYNESKPWQRIAANILVTDSLGLHPVQFTNVYGYYSFNISQIPYGVNTIFSISNTSYITREYIHTILPNVFYNLSFYLPPIVTPGPGPPGWNETNPYMIQVINQYLYPVPDAKVTFYRMFNTTGAFTYIGGFVSDGNGKGSIDLYPFQLYMIRITCDGYENATAFWTPNIVEKDMIKQFVIYPQGPTENESNITAELWDGITWSIQPTAYYYNDSFFMYFNISSSLSQLEWYRASLYMYNITSHVWMLLNSSNISSTTGGSICFLCPNTTAKYSFVCGFKKANFTSYSFSPRYYFVYVNATIVAHLQLIPDEVYLGITIFLMLVVMGVAAAIGVGPLSGLLGLIVEGIMFAFRPELAFQGVSVWFIFLATAIGYFVVMFIMRGR